MFRQRCKFAFRPSELLSTKYAGNSCSHLLIQAKTRLLAYHSRLFLTPFFLLTTLTSSTSQFCILFPQEFSLYGLFQKQILTKALMEAKWFWMFFHPSYRNWAITQTSKEPNNNGSLGSHSKVREEYIFVQVDISVPIL